MYYFNLLNADLPQEVSQEHKFLVLVFEELTTSMTTSDTSTVLKILLM